MRRTRSLIPLVGADSLGIFNALLENPPVKEKFAQPGSLAVTSGAFKGNDLEQSMDSEEGI